MISEDIMGRCGGQNCPPALAYKEWGSYWVNLNREMAEVPPAPLTEEHWHHSQPGRRGVQVDEEGRRSSTVTQKALFMIPPEMMELSFITPESNGNGDRGKNKTSGILLCVPDAHPVPCYSRRGPWHQAAAASPRRSLEMQSPRPRPGPNESISALFNKKPQVIHKHIQVWKGLPKSPSISPCLWVALDS